MTRLHLRSWRYLPAFIWRSLRSERQARRTEGNLHADLRRDRHGAFWTLTLWSDEGAMRRFMTSGAHRRAMPHLLDWCDEAALVHWDHDSREVPSWSEAERRLKSEGRTSKVRYPSEAHRKFEFPP